MTIYNKEFKVKFRGIRGSYSVSSDRVLKYGGNTACVEVQANGYTIILDAGTGIIELGNELFKSHIASGTNINNRKPMETFVFFSHSHMDHVQGLPFFKPLYINSTNVNLFGTRSHGKDFPQVVSDIIFKLMFPVELEEIPANVKIHNLKETNAVILDPDLSEPLIFRYSSEEEIKANENAVVVTCMKSNTHPKDGVMVYKIKCNGKSLVYATDKESYIGGDVKMINFARGTDLLIHDSQYSMEDYTSPIIPKQGYGHSTLEMAIETANRAKVSQLVLYHLDPSYDDKFIEKLEEKAKGQFTKASFARENLEIDLMQSKCKA